MIPKRFTPFPVLTTERLTLRALTMEDAAAIFTLRSDVDINRYLDRKPSASIDDARNFIGNILKGIAADTFIYWVITLTDSKKLLGTICLFNFSEENKQCEIGYELRTDYQGQGIMKEAAIRVVDYVFDTLGLQKMEACTHKDNLSSTKLLEVLHFRKTEAIAEDNSNIITFELTS